jgi:hypothetical protein
MREVTSRRLLVNLPASTVLTAHTDGACSGNPGPGGWSVVFSVAGAIVGEFAGCDADTTNNRMELGWLGKGGSAITPELSPCVERSTGCVPNVRLQVVAG